MLMMQAKPHPLNINSLDNSCNLDLQNIHSELDPLENA